MSRVSKLAIRTRGQSEVVGMVLILAITIAGTGIMVSVGGDMLDDSKQSMEVSNAEHAMTQLDSKTSLVGHSSSNAQEISLGIDGSDASVYARDDGAWMRVRIDQVDGGTEEIMNQTLGAVVYENNDVTIAYQGGGVWKRTSSSSSMVSPPEFHYRKRTLTLPLVVVDSDATIGNSLRISEGGPAEPVYPNETADRRNPLPQGTVNVTVKSEYYEAWGRYFEERTSSDVYYQPNKERVTIQLTTNSERPTVSQALASTSSEEMVIKGSGNSESFTDSYNSSVGNYSLTESSEGTIITSSGVDMSGDAKILGNLNSGAGTVSLNGGANITGNVSYGGSLVTGNNYNIGGWNASNGSAPTIDSVDGLIGAKHEFIKDNNNNTETNAISGNNLDFSDGSSIELQNGTYYLDEIDMSGNELVLNLSNGPIEIAVANDIQLSNGADITVKNPGQATAKIYMAGNSFSFSGSASSVQIDGDRSPALWLYGPAGTTGEIKKATFTGVIYSPDSDTKSGDISVSSSGEAFGAIIGGQMTLQSGGKVHFDQSLTQRDPVQPGQVSVSRVTYLHITVNHVNVTRT